MRKLREIVWKTFHPHPAVTAVLVLAASAGLVWCFLLGGEGTPASYMFYALSAYALAVVVAACLPRVAAIRDRALKNRHVARVAGDEGLRAGVAAAWSVFFDLAYAAFTMVTGFAYDSDWAVAVALYHVAIAGIGFALAFGFARVRRLQNDQRTVRELKMVRTCGIALALMAFALSGVMAQMVANQQAWVYDSITVIASAAFTFANLVFAIKNMVQVRRVGSPTFVASRATSLSKTLVQLFFLETTMIAVFGKADGEAFRFMMEAITGAVVFLLVLAAAVVLAVFASRRLRVAGGGRN